MEKESTTTIKQLREVGVLVHILLLHMHTHALALYMYFNILTRYVHFFAAAAAEPFPLCMRTSAGCKHISGLSWVCDILYIAKLSPG